MNKKLPYNWCHPTYIIRMQQKGTFRCSKIILWPGSAQWTKSSPCMCGMNSCPKPHSCIASCARREPTQLYQQPPIYWANSNLTAHPWRHHAPESWRMSNPRLAELGLPMEKRLGMLVPRRITTDATEFV
jgi:hypothetical protein